MIDGRIMAAVLASLAAVAAAISGGGFSADQVKESTVSAPGEFSFNDLMPESLSALERFFENPEPESEMKAVLVSSNLDGESFRVTDTRVHASNFSRMELSGKTLESDDDIELYGFTGEVMPGNTTELSGMSNGLLTSGVNVSGGLNTHQELETGRLDLEGVERSRFEMQASGEIESAGSSTEIRDARRVSIDSFSGDIRIYPGNSTIVLDGMVHELESGDFSFGG